MRGALCAVVVCGLILVPAGARASTFATPPPASAPVLAGPRVLWVVGGPTAAALREASPGRPPSTIGAFSRGFNVVNFFPSLAASPSRTAISFIAEDPGGYTERRVYTAPAGGPFETLDEGCAMSGAYDVPRAIDVSGDLVAYPRCPQSGSQQVVVRDYSTSPPSEEVIPGAVPTGVRIAGRYVGWLEGVTSAISSPAGIAVYDRVLKRIAYRIPHSAIPGGVSDFDLQEDGKAAFATSTRGGSRIGWASPSEPRAHLLRPSNPWSYEVHIAGDRIAYEISAQTCCGFVSSADVGVTDLAGHSRRVGNLGEGSLFGEDMDFDGTHVSWWTYGCTRAFVHVIRADGPPVILPRRSGCRLRFMAPPKIVAGRVHLYVDCFGFTVCDTSDVTLTRRSRGRRILVGRGNVASRVALKPAGKALLQRHRSLRVRASVTLSDGERKRERRSAFVTLRR